MVEIPPKLKGLVKPPILADFPEETILIGLVVSDWNTIEAMLTGLLAMLTHSRRVNIDGMVYALHNSSARLDVLESGLETATQTLSARAKSEIAEVLKESWSVLGARNRYAHGQYVVTRRRLRIQNHSEPKPRGGWPPVDKTHLNTVLRRMSDLKWKLVSLYGDALDDVIQHG